MAIHKTLYAKRYTLNLKNKRVLITAGPTWVPIDKVRVISNVATGQTGILLAEELQRLGAKVTLLLGPVANCCLSKKIKLIPFIFFDELKDKLKRALKAKRYDIVIHSAAVSDYRMAKIYPQKIKSGRENLKLNLIPTEKIIAAVKKINQKIFLIGFKFQPQADKHKLIKEANCLIAHAGLNLAVANSIHRNKYRAYIISQKKMCGPFLNRHNLSKELIKIIGETYGGAKVN